MKLRKDEQRAAWIVAVAALILELLICLELGPIYMLVVIGQFPVIGALAWIADRLQRPK